MDLLKDQFGSNMAVVTHNLEHIYMNISKYLVFIALFGLSGCYSLTNIIPEEDMVAGATGAVVGAGAGAALGSTVFVNQVVPGAIIGGAVGLPFAVASRRIYDYQKTKHAIERRNVEILRNNAQLVANEREISTLEQHNFDISQRNDPDPTLKTYVFAGPTLFYPYSSR